MKFFLHKRKMGVLLLSCTALFANAQTYFNPVAPANGFNVFTKNNLVAKAGDTHGPVAAGGDLELNGSTIFTMNTSGTYPTGNLNDYNNYGMVIGGKIVYTGGNTSQVNQGFMRLGNTAGSTVYYVDGNNAATNLKITPGGFNSNPNITLQRQQPAGTVTNASGLNFTNAFSLLNINSSKIAALSSGSCPALINKITISSDQNPHITLAENKINLIQLSGTQLNNLLSLGSIIFDNKPAATRLVVFNITATGNYTWNTPNLGGVDEANGAYMIWNFYTATGITLAGGNSVYGTILAPSADIVKSGANNNNGQVLGKSFIMGFGEVHYYPFNGLIPDCPGGGVVAVNGIDVASVLSGNAVTVSWSNAGSEDNVDFYSVEKSTDGINFTTFATVQKNDRYAATDAVLGDYSVLYYRIKVSTKTGSSFYSKIVTVRRSAASGLEIWPVPVSDRLNVSYTSANAQRISIQIIDNTGKATAAETVNVKKGVNQFSTETVSKLASGMYFIRITDSEGKGQVMKFIKK